MPEPLHHHSQSCRVAVIWIDWYAYHVARFRGLDASPSLAGRVTGIELVGGVGVHAGLKFREELPAGLDIHTLMPDSSWRDADKLQLARSLWRELSDLDPQVVLVPGYYTLPAIAAALWAKLHGRASVLMTESTAADHARVGWKELAKRMLIRTLFDWAVLGGRAHQDYLAQLGFSSDRIAGSYDVVDNEFFERGTERLRQSSAAADFSLPSKYFLYVGRLAAEKNVSELLSGWLQYRVSGGTWPLVFVGDGPLGPALRAAAAASHYAADVHFPGLKSSHELLPFYAFAGSFVLPSTREPWGLVVNEAMASHLPVLVSDRCGCAVDLVASGDNGFVFNPQDTPLLTSLLHRIESFPPAELARMGQRSGEIISRFTPQRFGSEIARIADSSSPDSSSQHLTLKSTAQPRRSS